MFSLFVVLAATPPDLTSPCLQSSFPSAVAALFELQAGARVGPTLDGPLATRLDIGRTICAETRDATAERRRVWSINDGVAEFFFAEAAALTPLDASAWDRFRRPPDEGGQTGCLRRFKRGTLLFDAPDGRPVAIVVDTVAFLGKWDDQRTRRGHWAAVRGFRLGQDVWVRVPSAADWCR
ncbi:MAG: hypothetical protein INH37_05845 [Myxococcaceae bacterium]|jgi:hypothetical protein|nr:hypothetical protein [Myxococcaceae bacterium]